MCNACVMNAVKARMMSRRKFFRAGAGAAVAAAAVTRPVMAQGARQVVDMTHKFTPQFPTFDGKPGIAIEQVYEIAKDGYNLLRFTIEEHSGTHIDAPLHFSADGTSVDELPVESLVVPLCVVHIHERAASDPDATVTPDDIKGWIQANGPIPAGACVAMHSGWEAKLGTDAYRGADDAGMLHFPGFHIEAINMLLEETEASCIAVDTLSLDPGNSQDFATHYTWLPAGRYGIENVANLAAVPPAGATLVVGAPVHQKGTGGPARVLALV